MKQVPDSHVFVIPPSQSNAQEGRVPTLDELEFLARWMDSVFRVPGTNVSFGFDALLGLIPGLGDTITSFVSLYILQAARRHGVSRVTLTRMGTNLAIDYVVGIVPGLGDAFDVSWKANLKNVELLRRHLHETPAEQRRVRKEDWWFFAGLVLILMVLLVGCVTIAWFVVSGVLSMLFT